MALTKSDIPDLLLPGLKAEFALAYRSEVDQSAAERIATIINTTLPSQKYAWLGTVPPMREFIDERRPSGLASNAVTISDKVFESTIAVDRRALEDDQLDLIRLRLRDLAFRVATHRHQMLVESLAGGFTGCGWMRTGRLEQTLQPVLDEFPSVFVGLQFGQVNTAVY